MYFIPNEFRPKKKSLPHKLLPKELRAMPFFFFFFLKMSNAKHTNSFSIVFLAHFFFLFFFLATFKKSQKLGSAHRAMWQN